MNNECITRRQKLLDRLPKRSVALIPAASEKKRNRDVNYRFRQDSHFFYLTQCDEPDALFVLIKNNTPQSIIFVRPRHPDQELWTGPRLGAEGAKAQTKTDEAYTLEQLDQVMLEILQGVDAIHYPFGEHKLWEERLQNWLAQLGHDPREGGEGPHHLVDLNPILAELRLYKSKTELAQMRRSAEVSMQAHRRVMTLCRDGVGEFELEAELYYEFIRHQCPLPAYNPIVGSGLNSCILHYEANQAYCKAGDLVLIDAGAEYQYYAADITRTLPVSGRYSPRQKAVYQWVLAAQQAVIDKIKPGVPWNELQNTAAAVLTRGLIDLGVLKGSMDELITSGSYKRYYPHQVGHWLGLDVHDVGTYQLQGEWRALAPGMVFTVEPGLYFGADKHSDYYGIGVRIEDNVLVTETGCEILTDQLPKTVQDIETYMAGG